MSFSIGDRVAANNNLELFGPLASLLEGRVGTIIEISRLYYRVQYEESLPPGFLMNSVLFKEDELEAV